MMRATPQPAAASPSSPNPGSVARPTQYTFFTPLAYGSPPISITSAMFSAASPAPLIHAGRLRGLAATGHSRSPLFPELPTIGEFYPGFELSVWVGIFAPAGVPDAALARLRAEINRVLPMPEVKERLNAAGGLEPYVTTPQEFADRIRSDYEKYRKLVKQVGAKVD